MPNTIYTAQEDTIQYSKVFSSLFCSASIIALSVLCLLNNFSIDLYSAILLLKVVVPASFCFWFLGFIIGKILDNLSKNNNLQSSTDEIGQKDEKAYEIPSMFTGGSVSADDDEFGGLV